MKQRYFELARKVSFKSPSQFKLGAVVINKNRVISVGFNNMKKTHPKMPGFGFLHAEVHALLGCDYRETRGGTIYIYRETLNGDLGHSKPCSICQSVISLAGIKEICYTTPQGYKKEKL